jgi:hypothetical protein
MKGEPSMVYRPFGNTGKQVSALGFGCMRLPMNGDGPDARVDREQAIPLLRAAYEGGINYFDTSWVYLNQDSQRVIGEALGPVRDKVFYATKIMPQFIKERDDFWKYLMATFERMDTGYIDFYQFHGLKTERWNMIQEHNVLSAAERALSKGYIKHLSFSFHDTPEVFKQYVDTGLFSSALIQYNMMDRTYEDAIAYAAGKGVGIAAMGPLAGGQLARGGPSFVKHIGSGASSSAEMALRFVWGNPSVSTAVSGMRTMEELQENLRYAPYANDKTGEDWTSLVRSVDKLKERDDLYCTGCGYCDACPVKIKPDQIFPMYLKHRIWGLDSEARQAYGRVGVKEWAGADPALCTGCGACSKLCPQNIDIPAQLKRVNEVLKGLTE